MEIGTDHAVFWQYGFLLINRTMVTTWGIMALLSVGSWAVTRNLSSGFVISTWQNFLEVIVDFMKQQLRDIGLHQTNRYLPFVGTLFLFIVVSNLMVIFPFYEAPTGSLSTTTALAICVFVAVPLFGIYQKGFLGYLKTFFKPSIFMFPFHVMSEISRTVALAVRLFGNVMSESMVVGILITVAPLVFPLIMKLFGLLTGLVQAYIFAILATVFIAAAAGEE